MLTPGSAGGTLFSVKAAEKKRNKHEPERFTIHSDLGFKSAPTEPVNYQNTSVKSGLKPQISAGRCRPLTAPFRPYLVEKHRGNS